MVDTQVETLVDLLEEKGTLNYSEFDNRVKKKLAEGQAEARKKIMVGHGQPILYKPNPT